MVRRLLAAVLAGLLALVSASLPAQARPLPAGAACTGVWVVVDGSTLDGGTTATKCATAFDTGTDALRSAGFEVRRGNGMICAIEGLPASCRVSTQAYWSYWQAARNADGSYGPWVYAQLGPDTYQPKQGDAEGWRFGAGEPPDVRPPEDKSSASPATVATPSPSGTPAPTPAGTPIGLLVTAGLLVAGALAAGGWWWRTRA
jgi:hypothetical protein